MPELIPGVDYAVAACMNCGRTERHTESEWRECYDSIVAPPRSEDGLIGMIGDCELCGERYDTTSRLSSVSDIGEFVNADGEHVIAHAQCGLDREWELA